MDDNGLSAPPPPYSVNSQPAVYHQDQLPKHGEYNQYPTNQQYSSGISSPPGSSVPYPAGGGVAYPKDGDRVIIVSQEAPINNYVPIKQSFTMHYVLSCLAFWLCGFLFGGIAFILAVFAKDKAANGERDSSREFSIASLALSIVGFVTGCIMWGFLIYYIVETCFTDCTYYKCGGLCYEEREYGYGSSACNQIPYSCFDQGYCYYNE